MLALLLPTQANAAGGSRAVVIAFSLDSHFGPMDSSLNGSFGYGLSVRTFEGSGLFQWTAGAAFGFSPAIARIQGNDRYADVFGCELLGGFALVPFGAESIGPVLHFNAILGGRLASTQDEATGALTKTAGITVGGQVGFGLHLPLGGVPLYLSGAYSVRRASHLLGQPGLNLDSITLEVGLTF